jgi:acetyl-CoA decarbonylase/synthase complex subunit delta
MAFQKLLERWSNPISTVIIGLESKREIKIGGETTLPFLLEEGEVPYPPRLALEILDQLPDPWPSTLEKAIGRPHPAEWAQKAEEWGADLVCLRLVGAHPDNKNSPPEEVVKIAEEVRSATSLPLIIWGCGQAEKDNQILPAISQALKGERCLFGSATQENYKILAATCLADGHHIIAESPLDINICKQVNILLGDMGLSAERIVIFPTTGALGYGFEYAYSIIERTRLAALGGDKTMAMPILAAIGADVWKVKEVRASQEEVPAWGKEFERGVTWEATTAVGFLLAGADLITMWHPEALRITKNYLSTMLKR